MCHGQKSRFSGDGKPPTFNDGIFLMGRLDIPYYWVEFPIPYGPMEIMGV